VSLARGCRDSVKKTVSKMSWAPTEAEGVYAFNLREQAPEIAERFSDYGCVAAKVRFLVWRDRREPFEAIFKTVTFSCADRDGDFWGNFFAAVRGARREVVQEKGLWNLDEDDAVVPYVVRLSGETGRSGNEGL
jgi:hypothetical protein